jgi:hypothetical protein
MIIIALGLYLIPTISVHSKLKRYDDKTPGFFIMQLRIRTYLKKFDNFNAVLYRKNSFLPKLWYIATFTSVIILALAFIV